MDSNAMMAAPAIVAPCPPACRIYLDKNAELFCLVSEEDSDWAQQWLWRAKPDRWGRKLYAVRNSRIRAEGRQITIFMHKAILAERMQILPPSPAHTIGDHGDGQSLNNQRWNLSYTTPVGNAATSRRWRR